jgi:hypothetical protein
VDIERLNAELRRKENLFAAGSRNIDTLNAQKDEQLREIKDLREQIVALKGDLSQDSTVTLKMQEKLNNNEILIADL